jgi:hypothetical protein
MKKNIYLLVSNRNARLETITTTIKASLLNLLLLMAATSAFAQKPNEKERKEAVNQKFDSTPQTIKGVVLSMEDSSVLYGANIILKGTGVGTITDKQGSFIFPQQLKEGDVLLASFVGHQTQEYLIHSNTGTSVVIKMNAGFDLTGDLAMNEVYTKPSGKRK